MFKLQCSSLASSDKHQLTQETPNPFDVHYPPSPGQRTPTFQHHLLSTQSSAFPGTPSIRGGKLSPKSGIATAAVTNPLTPQEPCSPGLAHLVLAPPTTSLSLHVPEFKMSLPPPKNSIRSSFSSKPNPLPSTPPSPSVSTNPNPALNGQTPTGVSKGQIHVKLIQAKGLNVRSNQSRPYVIVQFDNNEFVSRDPTVESDKEVKGAAQARSRTTSSNAINALGAIGEKAAAQQVKRNGNSPGSSPSSLNGSIKSLLSASPNGIFGGRLSARNPVWKHEVSFDVTSEESNIVFNVYDRSINDQGFLGTISIKPVLIHDHTVDQWYKLLPHENEPVSGEMRVQVTFEKSKTKNALTPRDFEFLKLIGRGTFGKVFLVRKKDTKRIYAMKVLSKKEIVAKKEVAHTIGERKILQKSLDSPFLVGLKFSFQTDNDLYLVTDFKSGGELFWHLQRETKFNEERARFYVAELVLALEHLHKYDIVYRDLKPENILLDATGHVALCDFGLSKADLRSDELTQTFCGTTEYLAPEVLLDEAGYSKLVDFWSLGVLLFEMCCGWSPFYAEDTQQMYKNICFGKIRFPKGSLSENGKLFVKGLLNRNPKHRLGAVRDAAELKEHPFFEGIDWKALSQKQVNPPFKPVVDSDESVANFDPEFTSADVRDVGFPEMDLDEEDPSEDWLSQSIHGIALHTPNGPLGSDRPTSPLLGGGSPPRSMAVEISKPKKKREELGSPLTESVQKEFAGFTFQGRESWTERAIKGHVEEAENEGAAVVDEELPEVTTEDEFDDFESAGGRLANARKRGVAFDLDGI